MKQVSSFPRCFWATGRSSLRRRSAPLPSQEILASRSANAPPTGPETASRPVAFGTLGRRLWVDLGGAVPRFCQQLSLPVQKPSVPSVFRKGSGVVVGLYEFLSRPSCWPVRGAGISTADASIPSPGQTTRCSIFS